MHWGIYSVPGIVESWSINSEDADWIPRDSTVNYDDYKKWYFNLNKQFNPVKFNPDQWAAYAKQAGMQYVVFTTKHHDGFAMFDTKQSDYKITAKEVPFSTNAKANITKEVFEAFRKKDFMIGLQPILQTSYAYRKQRRRKTMWIINNSPIWGMKIIGTLQKKKATVVLQSLRG